MTYFALQSSVRVLTECKTLFESLDSGLELSGTLLIAEVAVNVSFGVLDGGLGKTSTCRRMGHCADAADGCSGFDDVWYLAGGPQDEESSTEEQVKGHRDHGDEQVDHEDEDEDEDEHGRTSEDTGRVAVKLDVEYDCRPVDENEDN